MVKTSGAGAEELDVDGVVVRVIRSDRRRKTSAARLVDDGVIEVRVPAWLSETDRARTVHDLVGRIRKARPLASDLADLDERVRVLARRYDLPLPTSVRWVTNQARRWASCTPETGVIRVSSRLQRVPLWVLDAVLVHELAHLVVADHGPAFRAVEDRYPLRERADGFLEAMGLGLALDCYTVEGPAPTR
jgi:predicted metal-dependent hydrolase